MMNVKLPFCEYIHDVLTNLHLSIDLYAATEKHAPHRICLDTHGFLLSMMLKKGPSVCDTFVAVS